MKSQFINSLFEKFESSAQSENSLLKCLQEIGSRLNLAIKWEEIERVTEIHSDNLEQYEQALKMIISSITLSSIRELSDSLYPLIVELKEPNQLYILVSKWGRKHLYNPATNEYRSLQNLSILEITRTWQCCPLNFHASTVKPFGLLKAIFSQIKREVMNAVGIGAIVASAFLMISIISGFIFEHVHESNQLGYRMILGSFFLFIVGCTVLSYINGMYIKTLNFKVLSFVLPSVWRHLLNISMKYSKKFVSGEEVQKIIDFETTLSSIVTVSLGMAFDSLILFFLMGYMMHCNVMLAFLYLFICLLFSSIKAVLLPQNIRYLTLQSEQKGKIASLLNEIFLQINKCRSSHIEDIVFRKWLQASIDEKRHEEKSVKLELFSSILDISMPLLILLMFQLLIYTQPPSLSISTVLTLMICAGQFASEFEKLSQGALSLAHLLPALKRMEPILSAPIESYDITRSSCSLKGNITFSHIRWLNAETKKPILEDINIEVKAGQFVALIGASGSGKTSLFKLLLGFETPDKGNILIDGINMKNLNMQDVRKEFGVVLQTTHLFPGSIFSNIAANTQITLDEAWELARHVGLDQEIKAMPMKMHTYLSDNAEESISGGQKQKILIARALATHPKVLLLDEATSALDNQSQLIIYNNLKALNITRFVIAHRYSTIQEADVIYVLGHGTVIEKGTYEEIFEK